MRFMKNILFLLTVVAIPTSLSSQSFVFCPHIETEVKQGFENVPVSIVFLDSRTYEKKPKEKCTKSDIFQEFTQCIRRTYPGIQLTQLQESEFYKPNNNANIIIKVKFTKYDATFKTGTYNSSTQCDVQIHLISEKDSLIEQSVDGQGKAFNTLGYGSAKSALNKSFKEAFEKFIILLESVKAIDTKAIDNASLHPAVSSSRADRLRELKKLLDEGILNQQEFEKEKAKILEEKE